MKYSNLTLQEAHQMAQRGEMNEPTAILFVLEQLADMFEEINGSRPSVPEDEPIHVTLIRWMPIASDYRVMVRQRTTAQKQADDARSAQEEYRTEANQIVQDARSRAHKAEGTLIRFKKEVRAAMEVIDLIDAEESTP